MRKQKIHMTTVAVLLVIALSTGGCKKEPEQSIVVNKDFDNMIEEAENTGEMHEVSDLAKDYETYQTTLRDDSLKITAKIDAQVDIPETDRLSVLRVRQKDVTQEMLDTLIANTVQGQTLYDGSEIHSKRTKKMIEADIAYYQGELENADLSFETEEGKAAYMEECQASIDALQAEYEAAEDTIKVGEYKSDCKLRDIDELVSMYPSEFYDWEKSLNPDGQVFSGVSDGADGNYITIYAQNNNRRGNCIRYWRSNTSWMWNASVVPNPSMRWEADEEGPYVDIGDPIVEIEEGKTTISLQEAKNAADDFLDDMGICDFACEDGRLCNVDMSDGMRYSDEYFGSRAYKKMYAFKYLRDIDGVLVSDQDSKLVDGWQGDTYVKMDWSSEYIMIYVDDSGVVKFDYESPIEITDTVVEKAKVKSFAEIKDTFEQMVLISQAEEDVNIEVQIDRVELVYARISEANSFDTGLIVPVWNFNGTVIAEGAVKLNEEDSNILSINAIDSSIIDWELGY